MRRLVLMVLLGCGMLSSARADPPSEWKDYENPMLNVGMTVKRAWTEISLRETKETGSVTFQISRDPHESISVIRQSADASFTVWMSSASLLQLYEPGYRQSVSHDFMGRKANKVLGKSKDKEGRFEETYFFNHPPYVDQITFSAPQEQWDAAQKDFAPLRKSIHWLH